MGSVTQNDANYQFVSQDVEKQLLLLKTLSEEQTKELKKGMKTANALVKGEVVPRVMRFTGSTADSISSKVKMGTLSGSVTGITGAGKNRQHIFLFMQTGRAPGADMPPIERLIPWVEAKFGTSGEESKQAAFALAQSIQRKGIQGKPITKPVLEATKSRISEILATALRKVTEAMRV